MIIRPHPLLNHPVDAASRLHGIRRGSPSIVNIAGAQNKLHKAPDRNPNFLTMRFPFRTHYVHMISDGCTAKKLPTKIVRYLK